MLVLSLWLIVILTLLATSLLSHHVMQMRLMSMRKNSQIADSLARAGVAKAVADLRNDLILDYAENAVAFDAEGDIWKRPEEGKGRVEFGRGIYDVVVTDEESKININTATPQMLSSLLEILGYEEEDAKEAAAAIVDWRDPDEKPSLGTMAGGAKESEVYALMAAGGEATDEFDSDRMTPMRIKNDRFTTVDELLDVYGITAEMFYGPGSLEAETAALENRKQEWGGGKRFQIKNRRSSGRRDEPMVGLRDCVTVYSNGTLNPNTAELEVLAAAIKAGGIGGDEPERSARDVIEYRRSNTKEDISNNKAFRRISDLDESNGCGCKLTAIKNAYPLGLRSETFTIRSTGSLPRTRVQKTLVVVVRRSLETMVRPDNWEEMDLARERDRDSSWFFQAAPGRSGAGSSSRRKDGPDDKTVLWPSVRILQWMEN